VSEMLDRMRAGRLEVQLHGRPVGDRLDARAARHHARAGGARETRGKLPRTPRGLVCCWMLPNVKQVNELVQTGALVEA